MKTLLHAVFCLFLTTTQVVASSQRTRDQWPAAMLNGPIFVFEEGVPSDQQELIWIGITMANLYFQSFALGIDGKEVVVIASLESSPPPEVASEGHPAVTLGSTIYVYTSSPAWVEATDYVKYMILAHSYTHAIGSVEFSAAWMNEGWAEYFGWRIVAGLYDFSVAKAYHETNVRSHELPPLQSLEDAEAFYVSDPNIRHAHYSLAFTAADFLTTSSSLTSLVAFLADVGTVSLEESFEGNFGRTLEVFYEEFEEYRGANLSPFPQVKGVVTTTENAPVAGVYAYVCLFGADGVSGLCNGGEGITAEDGSYLVAVESGEYFLTFGLAQGASTPEEGFLGFYSTTSPTGLTFDVNAVTVITVSDDVSGIDVQVPLLP